MTLAEKKDRLGRLIEAAEAVDAGAMAFGNGEIRKALEASGLRATQHTLAVVFSAASSAIGLAEIAQMHKLHKSGLTVLPHVVAILRATADIFEAVEKGALSDG